MTNEPQYETETVASGLLGQVGDMVVNAADAVKDFSADVLGGDDDSDATDAADADDDMDDDAADDIDDDADNADDEAAEIETDDIEDEIEPAPLA